MPRKDLLTREIVAICSVFNRTSRIAELEDHLRCAIARLLEEGIPTESAFFQATKQLGESEFLQAEYRKNWHWLTGILWASRHGGWPVDSELNRCPVHQADHARRMIVVVRSANQR
jgi:hypothetical protein